MKESKFIKLIKTFTQQEIADFERWLKSPWCNSNKNLTVIFSKVKKSYPDFELKMTEEQLFRKVFPGKKYSYHAMKNLLSQLHTSAEKFLAHHHLKNNKRIHEHLLAKEYQSRHLEDGFFKILEKEIGELKAIEVKVWEDHLALLQYNRMAYNNLSPNIRVPSNEAIVSMDSHIDLLYLLEKAAIINEKIFRNRLLKNENYEIDIELRKWFAAAEGCENITVEFYKRRFRYTEDNLLQEFLSLRHDFMKHYREMNPKDRETHMFSLLNDLANLRRKKLVGLEEFVSLYNFGLASNLLLVNGFLTIITFSSIIIYNNALKNFDYTDEFFKKYRNYLDPKIREDAQQWAVAHTAYNRGDLNSCLDILLAYDFRNPYFLRVSKILNLQTYFDLYLSDSTYHDYLLNYCANFEKWILREKRLSKLKKSAILRFIQKSKELVKINSAPDFPKERLEKLLESEKNLEAGKWLRTKQEQIFNLKKGRN